MQRYVLPASRKDHRVGLVRYWEFYKLAIVGGTDFYSDVRGSETATLYARDPRREILVFRLV